MIVFNIGQRGNILAAALGESVGTLVSSDEADALVA